MAVDFFLKIDGIPGESIDDKHKDELDIESFSWGLANAGSLRPGGGGGAGKVSMQDFSFVKKIDKSSPLLALAAASGQFIKQAILTAKKAGEKENLEFYKVTLSEVLVSKFAQAGQESSGPAAPPGPILSDAGATVAPTPIPSQANEVTDSFSLNFSKIEYEYRPQNADGSLGAPVRMGWDLKKNTKA